MTLRRLSGSGALNCQVAPGWAASKLSVVAVDRSAWLSYAPPISMTRLEPDGGPGRSTPAPKPKARSTFRWGADRG